MQEGGPNPEPHAGIDIMLIEGGQIAACESGLVTLVGDSYDSVGPVKNVRIQHNEAYSTEIIFEPLQELYVRLGDRVTKGQVIGRIGTRPGGGMIHLAVVTGNKDLLNCPMKFLDAAGRTQLRSLYQLGPVEGLVDPCYEHTPANGYPNGCPSVH